VAFLKLGPMAVGDLGGGLGTSRQAVVSQLGC